MSDDVLRYYEGSAEREERRLERGEDGRVEFLVTCRTLAAHLPEAGRILDIGGGTGTYAAWLAARGHRVVVADISPALLERARGLLDDPVVRDGIESITVADARDLRRWETASFDGALALGPFYHLTAPEDRDRAAGELARVLRPGGVAVVALMPLLAFIRRTLSLEDERHRLGSEAFVREVLEEGLFHNDVPGRFTGAAGVRPEEVSGYFSGHGFEPVDLIAAEGIVEDLQPQMAEIAATDPELHRRVLDLVLATAGEPSILSMASHLLYVGRRRP
ncbi:MAG TPA: class I SAM-dependent methyltransferase [Candidatus Dormibacteraeota bacterium]|nr:class I SAM-dependent methyltransferase [Candidatus Dormibacteraeota bacterium]